MDNKRPMEPRDFLLKQAYQYCMDYTQAHREHFPVASLLLPKGLRSSIAVIYTFARQADEIADKDDYNPIERLKQLETYEKAILQLPQAHNYDSSFYAENYRQTNLVFVALYHLIQQHPLLEPSLFLDLLDAFKQDVSKNRYQTKTEVLDYCRRSANPVGRLLLYLTGNTTESQLKASDALCTALQLINFLNDIQSDFVERERCYMPLETLESAGLSVETLCLEKHQNAIQTFIHRQLDEIESFVTEGSALAAQCPGRFGFYSEMIIQSAYRMIHKLRLRKTIHQRLRFNTLDWIVVFWQSVVRYLKAC
jgi:hydroxysqualene synthase